MAIKPPAGNAAAKSSSVPHRKEWLRRKPKHSSKRYAFPRFLLFLTTLLALLTSSAAHESLDRRKPAILEDYISIQQIDSSALSIRSPRKPLQPRQSNFTMPTAFDGDIGNNFTSTTCLPWLQTMLTAVQPCYPVSLMLQTSISYFDATKSLVTITRVLSEACSVSYNQCSSLIAQYASQALNSNICLADYKLGNPIVSEAYTGLLAYEPIFAATCLTSNSTTGNYCYANAITNASSPSASYIYYLPLGVSLPAGISPTCDGCLQDTMEGFMTYATNATQPLSKTYPTAAQSIDLFCGPSFVNQNVIISAGTRTEHPWMTLCLILVAGLWLL